MSERASAAAERRSERAGGAGRVEPSDDGSTRDVLANGAVVRTLPLAGADHVAIAVAVRVGSRHEPPRLGGISHLLEHMLFRGTKEHPSSFSQNFAFESLGGTLDAATSAEATVFSAIVPDASAAEAIGLIAEMFREPLMAQLDIERNVVREELLDALDEDDRLVDPDELAARALFGDHPLGRSIGGSVESLARITERDLRAWHRARYVGANTVVALTGAVGREAREAARQAFGALDRGAPSRARRVRGRAARRRATLIDTTGSQAELRVAFVVPGVRDRDWLAMTTLARVLDDGMSARVFREMVEDRGLAYEAFGELEPYDDVAVFSLGAACQPARAGEALEALLGLARGAGRGLEERELARVRTRALFEIDLARSSPEARAALLLGEELDAKDASLARLAERVRAIRLPDLARSARRMFRRDALAVVAVGPLDAKARRGLAALARAF